MFANIRPSALILGAFAGYVVPQFVSLWAVMSLFSAASARDAYGATGFFWMAIFIHVGGPLVGGYVAAKFGRTQPLLHGLFAALLGWLVSTIFGNGVLIGILYVLAGTTGAAIWRSRRT